MSAVLETAVENELQNFVSRQELFTALDISNAVKDSGIVCRHRDVRDLVRTSFRAQKLAGYDATSILVTLVDGSVSEALLYYPQHLTLDEIEEKYDASRRAQTAKNPTDTSKVIASIKLLSRPKTLVAVVKDKVKGLLGTGDNDAASPDDGNEQ